MDSTSAPTQAPTTLVAALRAVIERIQRISGADILSLYLYDEASRTYFAPIAVGLPEDDLLASLSDMREQLAHYFVDAAQGKAPDELQLKHYGPNVWLTVTRETLIAKDARNEIDSSFIRRHHIVSVVGLPLITGERLVGLLYLNFAAPPGEKRRAAAALSAERIAELEREAGRAALTVDRAREVDERAALATLGRLAAILSISPVASDADDAGLRRQVSEALGHVVQAADFDAAAVYRIEPGGQYGPLDLVGEWNLANAPALLDVPHEPHASHTAGRADEGAYARSIAEALLPGGSELHLVAAVPLRRGEQLHGWQLFLSRDRLAAARRAPAIGVLLQTSADLIAGALVGQQLIATLEDTNRVLGALSRMSGALLQPGASRQQVLDALVEHLTDPRAPEFAFQFATVFVVDDANGDAAAAGQLVVRLAAGATTASGIDAAPSDGGAPIPRWAQLTNRALAPSDILSYVAHARHVAVVGPTPNEHGGNGVHDLVLGYPPGRLHPRSAPAIRADGHHVAAIPVVLIDSLASDHDREPFTAPATPFTLDGDIFESSGHHDLVRVFVPFGLDEEARATGVLEAGYHRSHRAHLDRMQIEALRACGAQVAVAVETARLYEDVKRQAELLEITTDVSRAIASSIELDQTLRLVAKNLARLVDASLCQIALYDEDGSGWHGAAASDEEELWRRQRGERPESSFVFDVLDRRAPLVIEDAQHSDLVNPHFARLFGIRSLMALPLIADDHAIGAAVLAQRERTRVFTPEEVKRTTGLAHQAAIAIKNARQHAFAEEERHIQKDFVLLGYGQWAQKAYKHLLTLKQFFNFKTHVVVPDRPGRREQLAAQEADVTANGDAFYWDHPDTPAREQLRRALESSCYVITYIATPAATHLPVLAEYYDLSNVVVIEKPLGAPPEAYREFLDGVDGGVEIVAADHYYFKLEVRLLQLLMTEERTLKTFVDSVEEIELELLEEQPLTGAAAAIGIIADMMPHAFAIVSLFTPIDRIDLAAESTTLELGRQEPLQGDKETYARLITTFPQQGRQVRLIITVGKGIENAKWIKLSGERRTGSRRSFYKFDFGKGEATDGTQTNLRAAVRPIRERGIPDNAHLTMLRHVIEKRHPAVGILAIREAMRSNQRVQALEALRDDLLAREQWAAYRQGKRPSFPAARLLRWPADPPAAALASKEAD